MIEQQIQALKLSSQNDSIEKDSFDKIIKIKDLEGMMIKSITKKKTK